MMNSIADILDKAADLIEPEGAWIRDEYARTERGSAVEPNSTAACRFCMIGAVAHVAGVSAGTAEKLLQDAAVYRALAGDRWSPANWNDAAGRTQAEVVAKLREAAAKAREQSS